MTNSKRVTDADLNAYVDGELNADDHQVVESWLQTHPEDRARVEAFSQQNRDLRELFGPVGDEPVPEELQNFVLKQASPIKNRNWMRIAAAVVLMLVSGVVGWGMRGFQDPPVMRELPSYVERAVGAHVVYASEVLHPVEVEATQESHLVEWLSKRLGSPLKAPQLISVGYSLIGGRLLEEEGRPAAQFMYEDAGGRRLTIYVRAYDGKDTAFKYFVDDELSAFYWIDAPFAFALTGNLPKSDLMDVAHIVYQDVSSK